MAPREAARPSRRHRGSRRYAPGHSNPLDDLERTTDITFVMKNGRLYDAATLDEVWPRQRELPTQWWWRIEPEETGAGGPGG